MLAEIATGEIHDVMTIAGVGVYAADRAERAVVELTVLRVFVGPDGRGGNPLGVVLDGSRVAAARRQAVAAELGFSETVFVDDAASGAIRILTPAAELAFAGHPTVGTGWLLRRLGLGGSVLRPPAGDVPTWQDGDLSWVRARPAWIHPITMRQLASSADVDALTGPPPGEGSYYAWAWIDEAAGTLRSRYFVPDYGIGEDEATGAAAVKIGSILGRRLEIHRASDRCSRSGRAPTAPSRSAGGSRRSRPARSAGSGDGRHRGSCRHPRRAQPGRVPLRAAHLIMHGNGAFLARSATRPSACPPGRSMTDLPREAFELMDRVLREGRPLARRVATPAGERRLVVVPRRDPETGETYGVTTHLRAPGPRADPTAGPGR